MEKREIVRSLDVTAEGLSSALDVLLRAGRALTRSADIRNALEEIAGAIVCTWCDYCAIELEGDGAEDERVRITAGAVPASSVGSTTIERLTDGRRTFGTITCRASSPGALDESACKALEILATELGVILGAKRVMNRERRVADRLQRALLPGILPEMPGGVFHAAYRPASDEAEIGGDWFDAYQLSDGRFAISIGDVAGHGLEAAVLMGEMRQAIRTAAIAVESPHEVLDYANRVVGLQESGGIVTAIFALYDSESSTLTYAAAGHPPPLIAMTSGLVRRLPCGTLPLGCSESLGAQDWTFTIPAGAHVVFYTDGLIENERDILSGETTLSRFVADIVRLPAKSRPSDPAAALVERVLRSRSNRDDVAVLWLSREAKVETYLFSAVPIAATIARAILDDALGAFPLECERRFGILVAIGEAVANSIEHAYRGDTSGLLRLHLVTEGTDLSFTVEDFGHWKPFVRREDRGRGIELMHAFMDGVQIRSTGDSTQIVLKSHCPEPSD